MTPYLKIVDFVNRKNWENSRKSLDLERIYGILAE